MVPRIIEFDERGSRTGYLVECGETDQIFSDPREVHTQADIRGEFS